MRQGKGLVKKSAHSLSKLTIKRPAKEAKATRQKTITKTGKFKALTKIPIEPQIMAAKDTSR